MAIEASGHDARVIESGGKDCRLECHGQMAVVALVAGRRMIDGLAGSNQVVVAGDAVADDFDVIHACQWHKAARGVAGVALLRRLDMPRWFGRSENGSAVSVAVDALTQGALEDAEAVARAAVGNGVGAVEAEAGRVMIEVRSDCCLREKRMGQQQNGQATDNASDELACSVTSNVMFARSRHLETVHVREGCRVVALLALHAELTLVNVVGGVTATAG